MNIGRVPSIESSIPTVAEIICRKPTESFADGWRVGGRVGGRLAGGRLNGEGARAGRRRAKSARAGRGKIDHINLLHLKLKLFTYCSQLFVYTVTREP